MLTIEIQKYKLRIFSSSSEIQITEIQITRLQKYKLKSFELRGEIFLLRVIFFIIG